MSNDRLGGHVRRGLEEGWGGTHGFVSQKYFAQSNRKFDQSVSKLL